jgi:erythrocyte band 7 integral membrane protein
MILSSGGCTFADFNRAKKSVIYYRITSPHKAAFNIINIRLGFVERTQTTLHYVIGARVLQDVIERRKEVAVSIREIIEDKMLFRFVGQKIDADRSRKFSVRLQRLESLAATANGELCSP